MDTLHGKYQYCNRLSCTSELCTSFVGQQLVGWPVAQKRPIKEI